MAEELVRLERTAPWPAACGCGPVLGRSRSMAEGKRRRVWAKPKPNSRGCGRSLGQILGRALVASRRRGARQPAVGPGIGLRMGYERRYDRWASAPCRLLEDSAHRRRAAPVPLHPFAERTLMRHLAEQLASASHGTFESTKSSKGIPATLS